MADMLYDIDTPHSNNARLVRITVLKEDVLPGATLPTCLVRYPDGSKARVDPQMYSTTPEDAFNKVIKDIKNALTAIDRQERELCHERERLRLTRETVISLANREGIKISREAESMTTARPASKFVIRPLLANIADMCKNHSQKAKAGTTDKPFYKAAAEKLYRLVDELDKEEKKLEHIPSDTKQEKKNDHTVHPRHRRPVPPGVLGRRQVGQQRLESAEMHILRHQAALTPSHLPIPAHKPKGPKQKTSDNTYMPHFPSPKDNRANTPTKRRRKP